MKILGLSAFFHDSAATLLIDGKIFAAAQEERFTRKKHDETFPVNSIKFVLEQSDLDILDIDAIVFYEKPIPKFVRLLETYVANAPLGFKSFKASMPIWLSEKLFLKKRIIKLIKKEFGKYDEHKLFFSDHHLSHAASAFYPSPFEDALILTLDGVGELATGTVYLGRGKELKIEKQINFPHSLGLLYSAFTQYLGFKVNSGEYKVMGLAPYGKPKYRDLIFKDLVDLKADGSFDLNQAYFEYMTGLSMISKKFESLFGEPRRVDESTPLRQFHMDVAASIQAVTEDIVLKIAESLSHEYNSKNLCLAGGVALNCVANSKLAEQGCYEEIFVQPCAGDAGASLGAALAFWHIHLGNERVVKLPDSMSGALLGPSFSDKEIQLELKRLGANFFTLDHEALLDEIAVKLYEGKIVGWFQGRMEFGPRSLGSRSILASPLIFDMQKTLNLKIKFRESFRPFAPAVLEEKACDWFDIHRPDPYMLFTSKVKHEHLLDVSETSNNLFGLDKLNLVRSKIPAVTHVDNSARVQSVNKATNQHFYNLISKFEDLSGCPILVNTSFNVRGEPIVCSVEDAYRCFMGTNLDVLAIGNQIILKESQDQKTNNLFKNEFALD